MAEQTSSGETPPPDLHLPELIGIWEDMAHQPPSYPPIKTLEEYCPSKVKAIIDATNYQHGRRIPPRHHRAIQKQLEAYLGYVGECIKERQLPLGMLCVQAAGLALVAGDTEKAQTYDGMARTLGIDPDQTDEFDLARIVSGQGGKETPAPLDQLETTAPDHTDNIMDACLATYLERYWFAACMAAQADPYVIPYFCRHIPLSKKPDFDMA